MPSQNSTLPPHRSLPLTTMEVLTNLIISSFLALFLLSFTTISDASFQRNGDGKPMLQTYIIQVRQPHNTRLFNHRQLQSYYKFFLPKTGDAFETSRMMYQYSDTIIGFAAKLTEVEVESIKKKHGFIKAYRDRTIPLLTTHTPTFLGLQGVNGFWKRDSNLGSGVVIGMIDTGVDPDHPSFHDHGMEPPPSKWKGQCMFEEPYRCNKKLIGGRGFSYGSTTDPPTDTEGHGTHTASTAAGSFVANASVLGNGKGTAAGMAPRAHLAIYKVCGIVGCATSAVLAGMDAAIKDGVDIMSISLGGNVHDYTEDVIAIAAFSAMKKGIFVSCAAGNNGPSLASLSNDAPWLLTVGASTMDRSIRVTVKLGDGQELYGESLYQPDNFTTEMLPLVVPGNNCDHYSMNGESVEGKIVVCYRIPMVPRIYLGEVVKRAGGAGMILVNDKSNGYTTLAEAHVLPASHISYDDGRKLLNYLQKEHNPTATFIFNGTILINGSAPSVASFSSRGPSTETPNVLKPDIIGPGVSILAGWPFPVGSSETTGSNFNIISGTSMSTPHLSGIAALLKSKHPDWSPAAIKSAIMTTSYSKSSDGKVITDEQHHPASYYRMGSGHVDPMKATDPGLVYDLERKDYIGFLCGLGYSDEKMEAVTHEQVSCSTIETIDQSGLNYPSISVSFEGSSKVTVKRTVTYVGDGAEKYKVNTNTRKGFDMSVEPNTLEFTKTGERKSFEVILARTVGGKDGIEGEISWISDKHVVRSPIVVTKYM